VKEPDDLEDLERAFDKAMRALHESGLSPA
jgi:hypothetical protein